MLTRELWVWTLTSKGHAIPGAAGSRTAETSEGGFCPFPFPSCMSWACERPSLWIHHFTAKRLWNVT